MSQWEAWTITALGMAVVFIGLVACIGFIQLFGRLSQNVTWGAAGHGPCGAWQRDACGRRTVARAAGALIPTGSCRRHGGHRRRPRTRAKALHEPARRPRDHPAHSRGWPDATPEKSREGSHGSARASYRWPRVQGRGQGTHRGAGDGRRRRRRVRRGSRAVRAPDGDRDGQAGAHQFGRAAGRGSRRPAAGARRARRRRHRGTRCPDWCCRSRSRKAMPSSRGSRFSSWKP